MRYIIDCSNLDISEFWKIFHLAQILLPSSFAQMFPFGIFICIDDPVRTSDVFGGGSDMTRHDVAMSLALIGLKIRRIFARRTHSRHMHIQYWAASKKRKICLRLSFLFSWQNEHDFLKCAFLNIPSINFCFSLNFLI